MDTSVLWLNDYLTPPADADEQANLLTRAGFPLEGREDLPSGDVRQDFEMTSNRGDCTCHVGMAREIAALSDRTLTLPEYAIEEHTPPATDLVTVTNEATDACPLYTARVMEGVTVKPSGDAIRSRLEARGDIPRNNLVDATNFVLFELGQPTHVFDLDLVQGSAIIVRWATPGERFLPLGEGAEEIELTADDLVIADAVKPIALAGVKGGAATAITESTTRILIEAATFDPVIVRHMSRRHGISSDSSFRFERGVSPLQVADASRRLASLISQEAGGTLREGVVAQGGETPDLGTVSVRPSQARALLGIDIDDAAMIDGLESLGFQPRGEGEEITCTVPCHRGDIHREVDLIEEIARMHGMDKIGVDDTITLRVAPLQPRQEATRKVQELLVGIGFVETISHTLLSDDDAAAFLPEGAGAMRIQEGRSTGAPSLRPSLLPSLLRVRKHNADHHGETADLFELAATFSLQNGDIHEAMTLGIIADVTDEAAGIRPLRGVLERLVAMVAGPDASCSVAATETAPWLTPAASFSVDGSLVGVIGLASPATLKRFGIDHPIICAELAIDPVLNAYPPLRHAAALPVFPAMERDLSAIIKDSVAWSNVQHAITDLAIDHLVGVEFVTTFRGKHIDDGHRSLTLRLRFRSDDRTLTSEEVDASMSVATVMLQEKFDATIRT